MEPIKQLDLVNIVNISGKL